MLFVVLVGFGVGRVLGQAGIGSGAGLIGWVTVDIYN